jgi:hypothetical protein
MLKINSKSFSILMLLFTIYISGCSGSDSEEDESEYNSEEIEKDEDFSSSEKESNAEILWSRIDKTAREEQKNEMYSRDKDSTYLYWLNNQLLITENSSKCNIFALNVLFKSGFKCPDENTRTYDLMDTNRYNDVFILIYSGSADDYVNEEIESGNVILKGDLIIWNGHVIIFESLMNINNRLYALGWWAGTKQQNNGENIINEVVHGKYPLTGEFIVRRPVLYK